MGGTGKNWGTNHIAAWPNMGGQAKNSGGWGLRRWEILLTSKMATNISYNHSIISKVMVGYSNITHSCNTFIHTSNKNNSSKHAIMWLQFQ